MTEPLTLFGLLFLGAGAGFINVMAGGGSSVTMPVLIILLGLEPALANGTVRVAVLLQSFSAIVAFRREGYQEIGKSLKLASFTLPGAVIGALAATRIDGEAFERVLGLVLIGVTVTLIVSRPKATPSQSSDPPRMGRLIYPAMLGIGFYGGFVQAGVGFLLMAPLHHLMKLDLVRVNMHKVFIIFVYTIPALAVFIFSGNVHWRHALVLAVGYSGGAWWSAKVAVKKGDAVIRFVLAGAIVLMAVRLLWFS